MQNRKQKTEMKKHTGLWNSEIKPRRVVCPYVKLYRWLVWTSGQKRNGKETPKVPLVEFQKKIQQISNFSPLYIPNTASRQPKKYERLISHKFEFFNWSDSVLCVSLALGAWDIAMHLLETYGAELCSQLAFDSSPVILCVDMLMAQHSVTTGTSSGILTFLNALVTFFPPCLNMQVRGSTPFVSLLLGVKNQGQGKKKKDRLEKYQKRKCVSIFLARFFIRHGALIHPIPQAWLELENFREQDGLRRVIRDFLSQKGFPAPLLLIVWNYFKTPFMSLFVDDWSAEPGWNLAKSHEKLFREFLDIAIQQEFPLLMPSARPKKDGGKKRKAVGEIEKIGKIGRIEKIGRIGERRTTEKR